MSTRRNIFIFGSFALFTGWSSSACISPEGGSGSAAYAITGIAGANASDGSGGPEADAQAVGNAGTQAVSDADTGAAGGSADCSDDAAAVTGKTDPVDLGTAADYVILAKTGIATVDTSAITGNVGDGAAVSAIADMERAFADAASRTADVSELGAGDIGGMTIEPGVYAWTTSLWVPGNVTLRGNATDVWIFQVAGDLLVSASKNITLHDGARAENVFWQVNGKVILGLHAHIEGTTLARASITLGQSASVYGRLLAQTSVHLDYNTITEPEDPIVLKSRCAEER